MKFIHAADIRPGRIPDPRAASPRRVEAADVLQ
jgi:hypothetical protein